MALAAHRRTSQSVAAVVETEHHRFLLRDDAIIGCEHREPAVRDQIAFAAMAVMATVAFLVPTPRDVLCLGLGAGTVPHFLRAAGIRTDAVEIDEAVIRLAEQHFLIGSLGPHSGAAGGAIFHGDALRWAISGPTDPSWADAAPADGQYDVVLCDMWSGANEGASLRRPFFAALRERWLRPGGVLAVNIVALLDGPHAALAVSVVRTLRAVFAHVGAYVEFDPSSESGADDADDEPANLLLLGSDRPLVHAPPHLVDEDGAPAEPGSMQHTFAHFAAWQPTRLHAATNGREGAVLETVEDWDELLPARRAIARGMSAQQQPLLPAQTWESVRALLEEAEETPPRRAAGRAPSPVKTPKEEL